MAAPSGSLAKLMLPFFYSFWPGMKLSVLRQLLGDIYPVAKVFRKLIWKLFAHERLHECESPTAVRLPLDLWLRRYGGCPLLGFSFPLFKILPSSLCRIQKHFLRHSSMQMKQITGLPWLLQDKKNEGDNGIKQ